MPSAFSLPGGHVSNSIVLAIQGLRKRYGRLEVLRGLDLRVDAGSVHGLVGLNGSGKTTTIECLLGLQRPDGGAISILGDSPLRLHRTRGRVGVVFDSPCLHPGLTVRQVLRHAAMMCGGQARSAEELESLLGIESYRSTRVSRLSLGNRRRASIAQALVGRPSLVVLDEPFSGLDAGGVDDVLDLIGKLNSADGTTFVLSSHQLPYLERVCTHMEILDGGVIALGGEIGELLRDRTTRIWLRVEGDRGRAVGFLRDRLGARGLEERPDGRIALDVEDLDPASINRQMVEAGFAVSELTSESPTLEALFRGVVGGDD